MDRLTVKAPAKLNLFLDITGKRPDGYHSLSSVMQSVDLYDYVDVIKASCGRISVRCSNPALDGEGNIAHKAALLFFEQTGISGGAEIYIDKNIPMEAGLAGGSTDAAAVLFGLDRLFEAGLSCEELCAIGAKCGADVPFSIIGSTMLAEGIGDEFTPLPPLPDCFIVIVKPKIGMSTKESYRFYDEHLLGKAEHADAQNLVVALQSGEVKKVCSSLYNVLEKTVPGTDIEDAKRRLIEEGAIGSAMTGSGTAVFGIFDDEAKAASCKEALSDLYESVFVTKPTAFGAEICEKAKRSE